MDLDGKKKKRKREFSSERKSGIDFRFVGQPTALPTGTVRFGNQLVLRGFNRGHGGLYFHPGLESYQIASSLRNTTLLRSSVLAPRVSYVA